MENRAKLSETAFLHVLLSSALLFPALLRDFEFVEDELASGRARHCPKEDLG
jgi:hypothetical protein